MPLVPSNYRPPLLFRNGHFSTIYAGVFRKITGIVQHRERLELPDGDFLDLDWSKGKVPSNRVVLLLHGLEGDAQRHYITGSAKQLIENGFDACAMNYRGCSGEPNRLYRSYHSGATDDLRHVVHTLLESHKYDAVFLFGYSLGGNLALKYVGDGNGVPKAVKAVVGISVPCDLKDACNQLLQPKNILYAARFKRKLLAKLKQKEELFPQNIAASEIAGIATLKDFDDVYTAPAHGFKDALDYYEQCSCKPVLPRIGVPTLILNALNDSFLGTSCYPYREAENNPNVFLEAPRYGGHVGFWGPQNKSYAEKRALKFFKSVNL